MPWIVKTAEVSQATGGLKITGLNTETTCKLDREFRWDITVSVDDPRYDWSKTVWGQNALDTYHRLQARHTKP
jgi:hypothetical protein